MENIKGAALMTLAMAGFAMEDTLIKFVASTLPTWQIVLSLGVGGAVIFAGLVRIQRARLFPVESLHPAVVIRNLGELFGIIGFVTALSLTKLSSASAILQSAPLLVTMGAALYLGETVGWRRWLAIAVGFVGVLLIVRPGAASFDASSLFAVQGVIGLAIRDLAVRRVPANVSSVQLSFQAFLVAIPAAICLALVFQQPVIVPDLGQWVMLLATVLVSVAAYYTVVLATRIGDLSYVMPFRYTRMIFALVMGYLVFDERPDHVMLIGIALIVLSGLFTLWRERQRLPAT